MGVTGELHALVPPAAPSQQAEEFVPRPEVAKAFAMGFDALLADYYWLRVVQIVGDSEGSAADNDRTLGRLVDVVTTLDPWVDHPYRFAAIWLTNSPESVRKANDLLRRGIEYHPHEWRNYFYLGFNLYFYLSENEEAARVLEQAVRLDGSPAYLGRLVARLRSSANDLETAAVFLAQLIRDSQDEAARVGYQAALDEIEIEHSARQLDLARAEYQRRNGRDIDAVEDLLRGPNAVLSALFDPEPSSTPAALRRGERWELDKKGRIVSSRYGRRYELAFHAFDARRRSEWAVGESAEAEVADGSR
jgi:tetratricopeptide (TPR) repeat protein